MIDTSNHRAKELYSKKWRNTFPELGDLGELLEEGYKKVHKPIAGTYLREVYFILNNRDCIPIPQYCDWIVESDPPC